MLPVGCKFFSPFITSRGPACKDESRKQKKYKRRGYLSIATLGFIECLDLPDNQDRCVVDGLCRFTQGSRVGGAGIL